MGDDYEISPAKIGRGVGYAIAAVIVVVLISVGIWWVHVATSGVRGKAGVIEKNNGSNNQIEAQHTFVALYGDIQSYKTKIDNAEANAKTHPGETFYDQVLTGLESTCSDAVQQYNADAASTTMKEWRPSDLPSQINPNDYFVVTP